MDRDDEGDQEGGAPPLKHMIRYLATGRIPRRVARGNIAKGFKHNGKNLQYTEKDITSVNQLAFALGYRNHSSLYPANHQLSRNVESLIMRLYDITENSECWKYFCGNEAENFIAEYDRSHADEISEPEEVTPVGGDVAGRARLVPLQWDAGAEDKSMATRYASLTLYTGNSPTVPVPGQVHLGLDLHCPEDRTDTLVTSLKRCLLTFDCAGGHTVPLAERTGCGGGEVFDGASFSTLGTSITAPAWEIAAVGPGGIGKVESVPATFIKIDGLKPGSAVKARIYAPVKEIMTTFVVPEDAGLSAARQRIKKRLVQLGIVGGESGEADLATSEIKVMARSDATEPDPEG